jgi:NCS1 family nucleobase:cation symporter-1
VSGAYTYASGINLRAVAAFVVASVIAAPLALITTFSTISPFAWPIGVVIGGCVYFGLMRGQQIIGLSPTEELAAAPAPTPATV